MILRKTASLRRRLAGCRPGPIVLVPTMGALHDGHLSLVRRARKLAGNKGTVVVSVFVNPLQFGAEEDFESYPASLAEDSRLAAEAGADLIFAPSPAEIYAGDHSVVVIENSLSHGLCGASRPGHFEGVCTVVLKLFHIVGPDAAVFGKKDYQQLAIIRRVARDLNVPVRIVGAPTVREKDGLALSSRNRYLTPVQRAQAPVIRKALLEGARRIKAGARTAAPVIGGARRRIESSGEARVDYIELVDAETIRGVSRIGKRKLLLAAAVFFGKARLIDNLEVLPPV